MGRCGVEERLTLASYLLCAGFEVPLSRCFRVWTQADQLGDQVV
jgi:hypothetical protein